MLSIKSLNKKYGQNSLFENFSYDFEETGIYIISGKSGIGKTTLLRIIAGIDNDYDGQVLNGGIQNTSFMFQEYRLFPELSAIDNILICLKEINNESELKAENMLISLGLQKADHEKKPSELSGGMKQRVSFVRALMKDTPILLLDEATKELNFELYSKMLEIIKDEAKKRLVILVTHKEDEADKLSATVINL